MPLAATLDDPPASLAPPLLAPRRAPPRPGAELSAIATGQLCVIEAEPGRDLTQPEQRLLRSANVILYDRALADAVAAVLPLGGYAEPASSSDDALVGRGARFVLDGWSVVCLTGAARSGSRRAALLRSLAGELGVQGTHLVLPCGRAIVLFEAAALRPPVAVVANGLAG